MRVLLTGSAGHVGRCLTAAFRDRYTLRTFDRVEHGDSPDHVQGDLGDVAVLTEAMRDCEVVVHLAAQPREADFQEVLVPDNIIGLHNTFAAVQAAGVRRMVFASTCQTVLAYPWDEVATVRISDPVRPSTLYGATKVFGEVMGRWWHDKHGLEFCGIRIGAFAADDSPHIHKLRTREVWRLLWLSEQDCAEIFTRAVDLPGLAYERFFATSITEREYLSRSELKAVLDYEPRRSVAEFSSENDEADA